MNSENSALTALSELKNLEANRVASEEAERQAAVMAEQRAREEAERRARERERVPANRAGELREGHGDSPRVECSGTGRPVRASRVVREAS